jgi:DNA repair protein RadC
MEEAHIDRTRMIDLLAEAIAQQDQIIPTYEDRAVAATILREFHSWQLVYLSVDDLRGIDGLSAAQARRLASSFTFARNYWTLVAREQHPCISSAEEAYRLLRPLMSALDHEEMRVLLMNAHNDVEANLVLYVGTDLFTFGRMAEILRPAILRRCPKMILAHNHPTGDSVPSPDDIELTYQVSDACQLMDITLLDHLVIGAQSYHSIAPRYLPWE